MFQTQPHFVCPGRLNLTLLACRKERRAVRVREQNKGLYVEPLQKDKGQRQNIKKQANRDRGIHCPSPTLSLSAFDFTNEEDAPMEVDTDLFMELTPKANLTMDKGLPTSGTQSTPTPHPNTAIPASPNAIGMQIASQMEPDPQGQRDHPPHLPELRSQHNEYHYITPPGNQRGVREETQGWHGDKGGSPMRGMSPVLLADKDQAPLDGNAPELD
ncbi:hypothetical protein H2248_003444 [Termitomyces sp. 'cryptogamus']|nr:hypothetical protein H2248_003444 [Termitomyces sp. 'cryptogamus']